MMNTIKNTTLDEPIRLTPRQTTELRSVWSGVKGSISKHKHDSVELRLSRTAASITPKQLYMISTQACKSRVALPDWVYEILGL